MAVIVETMAHNHYLKFEREPASNSAFARFQRDGEHPILYIEPKGHGIEALDDDSERPAASRAVDSGAKGVVKKGLGGLLKGLNKAKKIVTLEPPETVRVYSYTGKAEDPEAAGASVVAGQSPTTGYDLEPIYDTLWKDAQGYVKRHVWGSRKDYGTPYDPGGDSRLRRVHTDPGHAGSARLSAAWRGRCDQHGPPSLGLVRHGRA